MIVNIRGILARKMPEEIVIETGGLGYACRISINTYDQLPKPGSEVSLLTYFQVQNMRNIQQNPIYRYSMNLCPTF